MRRLKVLLAVLVICLVFMLGFNVWHGEEMLATDFQVQAVETGNVLTWTVQTWAVEETVIYTREDTEKELAGKLNSLIGNYSISYAVVHECSMQTNDYKLCIKNVMWVANAESSMFKKWMKPSNNGFGRMYKWKKRKFSSVENSIKQWVAMYVRNGREKRATWQDWLRGKYCTSACSNWTKLYASAVSKVEKLGLE